MTSINRSDGKNTADPLQEAQEGAGLDAKNLTPEQIEQAGQITKAELEKTFTLAEGVVTPMADNREKMADVLGDDKNKNPVLEPEETSLAQKISKVIKYGGATGLATVTTATALSSSALAQEQADEFELPPEMEQYLQETLGETGVQDVINEASKEGMSAFAAFFKGLGSVVFSKSVLMATPLVYNSYEGYRQAKIKEPWKIAADNAITTAVGGLALGAVVAALPAYALGPWAFAGVFATTNALRGAHRRGSTNNSFFNKKELDTLFETERFGSIPQVKGDKKQIKEKLKEANKLTKLTDKLASFEGNDAVRILASKKFSDQEKAEIKKLFPNELGLANADKAETIEKLTSKKERLSQGDEEETNLQQQEAVNRTRNNLEKYPPIEIQRRLDVIIDWIVRASLSNEDEEDRKMAVNHLTRNLPGVGNGNLPNMLKKIGVQGRNASYFGDLRTGTRDDLRKGVLNSLVRNITSVKSDKEVFSGTGAIDNIIENSRDSIFANFGRGAYEVADFVNITKLWRRNYTKSEAFVMLMEAADDLEAEGVGRQDYSKFEARQPNGKPFWMNDKKISKELISGDAFMSNLMEDIFETPEKLSKLSEAIDYKEHFYALALLKESLDLPEIKELLYQIAISNLGNNELNFKKLFYAGKTSDGKPVKPEEMDIPSKVEFKKLDSESILTIMQDALGLEEDTILTNLEGMVNELPIAKRKKIEHYGKKAVFEKFKEQVNADNLDDILEKIYGEEAEGKRVELLEKIGEKTRRAAIDKHYPFSKKQGNPYAANINNKIAEKIKKVDKSLKKGISPINIGAKYIASGTGKVLGPIIETLGEWFQFGRGKDNDPGGDLPKKTLGFFEEVANFVEVEDVSNQRRANATRSEPQQQPQSAPEPEPQQQPQSASEPEPQQQPQSAPEPEPQPQSQPQSAPESEPSPQELAPSLDLDTDIGASRELDEEGALSQDNLDNLLNSVDQEANESLDEQEQIKQRILSGDFNKDDIENIEELTVDIAHKIKFSGFRNIDFDKLRRLELDEAKILGGFIKNRLQFKSLTHISPLVMKELCKAVVSELCFVNCFNQLSPEIAIALASFNGYTLKIEGLAKLESEEAKELAKYNGYVLILNDLQVITPNAIKELAQSTVGSIMFSGLSVSDDAAILALAKFEGEIIGLDNATETAVINKKAEVAEQESEEDADDLGLDLETEAEVAEQESEQDTDDLGLDLETEAEVAEQESEEDADDLGLGSELGSEPAQEEADSQQQQSSLQTSPSDEVVDAEWSEVDDSASEEVIDAPQIDDAPESANEKKAELDIQAMAEEDADDLGLGSELGSEPAQEEADSQQQQSSLQTSPSDEVVDAEWSEVDDSASEEVIDASQIDDAPESANEEDLELGLEEDAEITEEEVGDVLTGLSDTENEAIDDLLDDIGDEMPAEAEEASSEDEQEQLQLYQKILEGNFSYSDIQALKSLTPEVAEKLANGNSTSLYLNGLTSITPEVAEKLAKGNLNYLYLNRLTSITPEVAEKLANGNSTSLYLNGLTSITPEVAEKLANNNLTSLHLSGLTSIAPEVAEKLANNNLTSLHLNRLTSITPEVAEKLANNNLTFLSLDGLTSITPDVAEKLANGNFNYLYLNGLTSITPDVAEKLANGNLGRLYLDGLTSITPEVAEKLANNNLTSLFLDGLTSITPEVAEKLANNNSASLHLDGLTSITPEVAEKLANNNLTFLSLDRLTSITPDVAEKLANGNFNYLYLKGLTSITPEVAEKLAKGNLGHLHLYGLTSISSEVAEKLSKGNLNRLSLNNTLRDQQEVKEKLGSKLSEY